MYLGYKKESKSINNAVKATQGEFLVDKQGLVVDAYYSSHTGTYSSYPEYVWGLAPKHYLQAVKEFSTETKAWDLKLSINDLAEKLKDLKFQKISALTILKRSPEGRVNSILISGSKNNLLTHATLTGEEFRHHLGLRSSNFDLNWIQAETILNQAPIKKKRFSWRMFLFKKEKTDDVIPPPKKIITTKLIISGKGYGHGIGLSQYDAKFLASQGKSYKHILGYYYQGARIIKRE
jgi:stage II sporulation protein D